MTNRDYEIKKISIIADSRNVNQQRYDIKKGYTVIDGFGYTALTYPFNVHDAIIIKCKGRSDCLYPRLYDDAPNHEIENYVKIINQNKIEKAKIIFDDIRFMKECRSLRYINVYPSCQSSPDFDFSPLYDMPEILSLSCSARYGDRGQYTSHIDYSKVKGLVALDVKVTNGMINYNRIYTLKSLSVSDFKRGADLTGLFCSEQLDTLRMIQCGVASLHGIDISKNMQCLYLHYNRSLSDISALYSVKKTLKALRIENCPQIKDFSVLGKLENLELLELSGNNEIPNLNFLKTMKNLKTFIFSVNVLDGNLSLCKNISYVYSIRNKKHYNLKDRCLPKGQLVHGNDEIDEWRKME